MLGDFYKKYKCDVALWALLALVMLYVFFPKMIEHFEASNSDTNTYMTVTPNSSTGQNMNTGARVPNSTAAMNRQQPTQRPTQRPTQQMQPELQKQVAQQQNQDAGNFVCDSGNFISANLLPKISSELNEEAFQFAPKDLTNMNFLEATDTIGVDTVSSSLRNASYDIRSTPTNPRDVVSPWMNSTIDPELERRPLE